MRSKRFVTASALAIATLIAGSVMAQPVIDGAVNGLSEYAASLGTSDPATSTYGPWGLHEVFADQDSTNIYLGVRATPEINFNSTVIVIGNNNAINGIDASVALPDSGGGGGLGNIDLTVGFEADFAFRMTAGNSNEAYFNALKFAGEPADGSAPQVYLGGGAGHATGTVLNITGGTVDGGTFDGMQICFNKASGDYLTNTVEGIEFRIPKALLGANPGDTISLAVLYGNSDCNNYSNQQVPANASGGAAPVTITVATSVEEWSLLD